MMETKITPNYKNLIKVYYFDTKDMAAIVNHSTKTDERFDYVRGTTLLADSLEALVLGGPLRISQVGGPILKKQVASADPGSDVATLTVKQLKDGILDRLMGGAAAWTLPSAALVVAGMPGAVVGDTLDFSIINRGAAVAHITVGAGAGGSLVGQPVVESAAAAANSSSGSFLLRLTNVTAGAQAYVCYRA